MIVGGGEGNAEFLAAVRVAAVMNEPWAVPEERGVCIWVARGPFRPVQTVWPQFEARN